MALNVTTAVFAENCNTATASPSLAQWDTEQVLQISGIELPDSYKVEFSTVYTRNAIPEIGDASGVTIPNVLLQRSAPITAYIVLYGENGGRNREYWITIYITPGQPPETITPDPEQADVIDEAIAALNNGVARTEAAATSAEGSARDAEAAAEAVQNLSVAAETLATGEPATVEKTVDEETGAVTLNFGLPRGAKGDPLTYEELTPEQKAELVQGPILEAQDAAVTAVGNARTSAVDAVGSAGTTQVNAVNQAGTAQTGTVNQAGANQVAAVNQAGTTQVQAVEDKGAEVLDSIPQDYSDLADDVADLSRQISDETTGLDTKAPVILETASGAIASFSDGADSMPIRKLVAQIEPVQDLHGYDHPWPGGGNVNIGNFVMNKGVNTSGIVDNISGRAATVDPIRIEDGKNYYVKAVGTNPLAIIAVWNGDSLVRRVAGINLNTALDVSGGTDLYVCVYETNSSLSIVGVDENQLMVVTDNSVTSYSPYSNECPISGWTGAEITMTGENLIDWKVSSTAKAVYLKPGTYVLSWNGTFSDSGVWYMRAKDSSGNYYNSKSALGLGAAWTHSNSSHWNYANVNVPIVFTVPSGCSVVEFFRQNKDGTIPAQLELGSTATAYAPYTGNQISVDWQTEAGTVYGATMTLNPDRTGTLVVDKGIVDLGTLTWVKGTASGQFYSETNFGALNSADIFCSEFRYGQAYSGTEDNVIELRIGTYHRTWVRSTPYSGMKVSEFKSAMSGVQLVYPLASPQTYQLTAEQVSGILTTLYGTNNIWSSTGDTEVAYTADTKLYIEQLTKPTEDDMTADHAISSGSFFMIGNTLYLATSQIAAGATITPGTNATKLSLADALNQLNT